jgi:hypothetical protein
MQVCDQHILDDLKTTGGYIRGGVHKHNLAHYPGVRNRRKLNDAGRKGGLVKRMIKPVCVTMQECERFFNTAVQAEGGYGVAWVHVAAVPGR